MKKLFKKQKNTSMPPLEVEEEEVPHRNSSAPMWITLLCVVLIIALVVSSLPSAPSSSTSVRSSVLNCQASPETIPSVLYGAGMLIPQEGTELEVPQALEIQNYYVKNGQILREGDPIAAFDPVEVQTAVTDLQSVIRDLDEAIADAYDSKPSETIRAGTDGRVKKIYAEKGVSVADTVYQYGALMLLSLDGSMAVDLEGELSLGQSVTVILPDGTELPGEVAGVDEGVSTVTVSDEKSELDDLVTVRDADGRLLGEGPLYIHSMLRVTGVNGTVNSVVAAHNKKVSKDYTLITLKDTGRTAEYYSLLSRRAELEEHLDSLLQLGSDGILRAKGTGIVSGVDTEIDYVSPDTLESRQPSHASPGPVKLSADNQSGRTGGEGGAGGSGGTEGEGGAGGSGGTEGGGGAGGSGDTGGEGDTGGTDETKYPTVTPPDFDFDKLPPEQQKEIMDQLKEQLGQEMMGQLKEEMMSQMMGQMGGMMGGMTGGMMGGFGGMSSFGSMGYSGAQAASYDTYDTTRKAVITLTGQDEMTIEFPVDELDILSVRTGMKAQVTLDALPGQSFAGTVTKINTYGVNSGGNTKYTVTVTLPRKDQMLSGMNASVQLTTSVSDAVPTLPAAAIQFQGGSSWVYTGYDEKTDTLSGLTQIQTGLSDGYHVELLTDFPEGTTFYYRYADSIEYRFER